MPEEVESLEIKVDAASSYLAGVVEKAAAGMKASKNRKAIKIGNTLLGKYDSYSHQLGEELYNTLDAVMRTAKHYGEKEAQKVAASSTYDIRPLIDIMEEDAKKIGCENLRIHEIYERVRAQDTVLAGLFGEMAPYNELMDAWKKYAEKGEETLLGDELSRGFYEFKIGIDRKKRGKNSMMSLPWIASIYSLFSPDPLLAAPQTFLYLSAFNLSREGLRRFVLEDPKKMRPRLELIDERIKQHLPKPLKDMQKGVIEKLNRIEARKRAMKELNDKMKRYDEMKKDGKQKMEKAEMLSSLKAFDAKKKMEEYQNTMYAEGMFGWGVGKMVEGLDSAERKLNRAGWSIPYLIILGAEACYFQMAGLGISPMLGRMPSILMWTYGVPLVTYGAKKIKAGANKSKAYIKSMTRVKRSEGDFFQKVKEEAKKYEDMRTAKGYLEEPPDPSKQGKIKKLDRMLSTFKFSLGKDRHIGLRVPRTNIARDLKIPLGGKYLNLLEFPFIFNKRSEEDLKKVNELVAEDLEKDYGPEIAEIMRSSYLPYITLGEDTLNKAIGIKPTVSSVVVYEYKERARKFGETEYHIGDPHFMKPVVEEMMKRRKGDGKNIIVRKKVKGSWMEEQYNPSIFDYRHDYQILALSNGYEELILGAKYEWKKVRKESRMARLASKIEKMSEKIPLKRPLSVVGPRAEKMSEKLFYKDEANCLYLEGSAIRNFEENAVRKGMITQLPRFTPRMVETESGKYIIHDVTYDLEEYQIYSTDMSTQPDLFADIVHEARHVANSLEMWENTKELGKKLLKGSPQKSPIS